jgi:hypothetical protein
MSARYWFVIALGILMVPTAKAGMEGVAKVSDTVFAGAQGYELAAESRSDISDIANSSVPTHGMRVSPLGIWKISLLDIGTCKAANCQRYRLRNVAFTQIEERQAEAASISGARSSSGAMSMLDLALMLMFLLGLLAYQLDRKQRVLQQSSLFSVSL